MARFGSLALAVLAVVALAMVAASLDTVSTAPTVTTGESTGDSTPPPQGPGGGGPGTPEGTQSATRIPETETETAAASNASDGPPRWQVVAGLALVVLGGLVVLYELTRGEATEPDSDDEDPPPTPTAPAADSVLLTGDTPPENDVYRAWSALRTHVESVGEASGLSAEKPVTPADVREGAIESGLPQQPVTALTELFCAVRYGDAAATPERERRARAVVTTLSLDTPVRGDAS
ncbi:DUF4129 domain-containing protein [Haloarcula argentinensis]|uniref:DUF4129 domain-containing protein n=1 Tax=Haloarcula argentinensis TaxID=43776 RepID=A0ABU2F2M6_HALAR|nr:DUF4129 domain-containing protein [Haloarcula argentinensis]EMA19703.1 hypothetical protein C443_15524 [Haloarcula argentinensis DSM 12282]MDS0254468.1 DUF4129 domain-containing protein [Haloarcula argentinensis]